MTEAKNMNRAEKGIAVANLLVKFRHSENPLARDVAEFFDEWMVRALAAESRIADLQAALNTAEATLFQLRTTLGPVVRAVETETGEMLICAMADAYNWVRQHGRPFWESGE